MTVRNSEREGGESPFLFACGYVKSAYLVFSPYGQIEMNMQALYEEMKAALRFFDLGFGDKEQVTVSVVDGKIAFENGGRKIMIEISHDSD